MKRSQKILTFVLLLGLVGMGIYALIPKKGTLIVKTTPENANVKLDGRTVDNHTMKLQPAKYTLEVSSDDYIAQTKQVTISTRKTTEVRVSLDSNSTKNIVEATFRNAVYASYPDAKLNVVRVREVSGGEWLVGELIVNEEEDRLAILHKNGTEKDYKLVVTGPPFNPDVIANLPKEVQALVNDTPWLEVTP